MKKFRNTLIKYGIIAAVSFVLALILIGYFSTGEWMPNFSYASTAAGIMALAVVCFALYELLKVMDGKGKKKGDKAVDEAKDTKGNKVNQYFNTDFVTVEELEKNKAFNYNSVASLRQCKKDGILVRAEEKNNNIKY